MERHPRSLFLNHGSKICSNLWCAASSSEPLNENRRSLLQVIRLHNISSYRFTLMRLSFIFMKISHSKAFAALMRKEIGTGLYLRVVSICWYIIGLTPLPSDDIMLNKQINKCSIVSIFVQSVYHIFLQNTTFIFLPVVIYFIFFSVMIYWEQCERKGYR